MSTVLPPQNEHYNARYWTLYPFGHGSWTKHPNYPVWCETVATVLDAHGMHDLAHRQRLATPPDNKTPTESRRVCLAAMDVNPGIFDELLPVYVLLFG